MGIGGDQFKPDTIPEAKLDATVRAKLNSGMTPLTHDTRDHTGVPGIPADEAFTEAAHDVHDHAGLTGIPPAEAFTSGVHSTQDHTGITGVPAAETFTAATHSSTNHAGLSGIPNNNNFGVGSYGALIPSPTIVLGGYNAFGDLADPKVSLDQTRMLGASSLAGFQGGIGAIDCGLGAPPGSRGGAILGKGLYTQGFGRLVGLIGGQGSQSRVFFGFSDSSNPVLSLVLADSPIVDHIGFQYSNPRGDTNWMLSRRDTSTQLTNTGFARTPGLISLFIIDFLPSGVAFQEKARVRIFDTNFFDFANGVWNAAAFDQTFTTQIPSGSLSVFLAIEQVTATRVTVEYTSVTYQAWANIGPLPA